MRVLLLVSAIVLLSIAVSESRKYKARNQKTDVQLRSTSSNKSNKNGQYGKAAGSSNNKNGHQSKFRRATHKIHEKLSCAGKWLSGKISGHHNLTAEEKACLAKSNDGKAAQYNNSSTANVTTGGSSNSSNSNNSNTSIAKLPSANGVSLTGSGIVSIGNVTLAVNVSLAGIPSADINSFITVNVTSAGNSTIAVNVTVGRNSTIEGNSTLPNNGTSKDDPPDSTEMAADEFVIRSIADLAQADDHMKISILDLEIPAGKTLNLELLPGAKLTFRGVLKFGFKLWEGPLIQIRGTNVSIVGAPGHLIDCGGKRWWDGKGGNGGVKKPKFFFARLTDSKVTGLNVKNTPVHGFSINSCKNVVFSKIIFNNSDGAIKHGGHNTDAFDLGNSDNVVIKDSYVDNQDDCLAINSGTRIVFENNFCSGGHGISIGSVGKRRSNVVSDVTIKNNTVSNSDNGIRIKTVSKAIGSVNNVIFENIVLKDIRKVGITIQGNYLNGGPKGEPTPGVPITNMVMKNIRGNVLSGGTDIYVFVANASNWYMNTDVVGGLKKKPCKGFPKDMKPLC